MTAGQACLPPTGRGRQAARPDGFYQPDPPAGPVRDCDGVLRVAFAGEDGRAHTYSFARLPLAGMHEDLAAAFAERTGPAGTRRTLASADISWFKLSGMLRYLASLPRPPQDLAALRRSHLERLRRRRLLTKQPLTVSKEVATSAPRSYGTRTAERRSVPSWMPTSSARTGERDDVDYIMETFPIVKRKDVAKYGSYRSKETITTSTIAWRLPTLPMSLTRRPSRRHRPLGLGIQPASACRTSCGLGSDCGWARPGRRRRIGEPLPAWRS